MSPRSMFGITAMLLLGVAGDAWAQQAARGTITGQIRDAASRAPVNAVQVYVPGLNIGSLSQASGRYLLVNVPAGRHTVRIERIGYRAESRDVTVTAGAAVEVNVDLTEDALSLDEIVVTGTAGQARRREVGNTISQIRVGQVAEPVADVGSLLQGRLAGVQVAEGSGNSGSGSEIKLRGNVSATMSNSPLIYIDGVRAKSEPFASTSRANGPGTDGGAGDLFGPLAAINPEDIERIEIVKGPAATTLYGSEAAAGVIQIFTKRGGSGTPQVSAETRQGFSYLRPFSTSEAPYGFIDPVMRDGHRQQYSATFNGGSNEQIAYFLSGQFSHNKGPVINDAEKQLNLRANIQFKPGEDWLVQINNSFTQSAIDNASMGAAGVVYAALMGDLSIAHRRNPLVLQNMMDRPNDTDIARNIHGLTLTYTPFPSFTNRLTVGNDDSRFESTRITPFGYRTPIQAIVGRDLTDLGSINRVSNRNRLRSIDYVGTLGFGLTDNVHNTLSFGVQGVENTEETLWAAGSTFPGPGDYTITSSAIREGFQSKLRSVTGGFFFQDLIALSDRYFLTLGVRVDGNSAFGSGFGLQSYPKASLSYVVSDEGFWPQGLGSMKLRAAYGWAGRAPGAFDAVQTWSPVGWGNNLAAFVPGNLGNDQLGPERTSEVEVGFDGSFLNERLTAEYTYFERKTTDALMAVGSAPSLGYWRPQLQNVGELKNWGHEVMLNGRILAKSSFGWELGAGISVQNSKVVTLGGSAPFLLERFAWIMEGEPIPVYRGSRINNYFEAADPIIENDVSIGPGHPPLTLALNTSFTLPGGLVLSGRGEYQGTFYVHHHMNRIHLSRNVPWAYCYDAYRKVDPAWQVGAPGSESAVPKRPAAWPSDMLAWERAKCFGYDERLSVSPVQYFELRDLTLSIPVSNLVPALAAWGDRTDLTISARNLWYWKNKELGAGHPEQTERWGIGSFDYPLERKIGNSLPPASTFTVSARFIL